jgi:hypothetical protein
MVRHVWVSIIALILKKSLSFKEIWSQNCNVRYTTISIPFLLAHPSVLPSSTHKNYCIIYPALFFLGMFDFEDGVTISFITPAIPRSIERYSPEETFIPYFKITLSSLPIPVVARLLGLRVRIAIGTWTVFIVNVLCRTGKGLFQSYISLIQGNPIACV